MLEDRESPHPHEAFVPGGQTKMKQPSTSSPRSFLTVTCAPGKIAEGHAMGGDGGGTLPGMVGRTTVEVTLN